MVTGGRVLHHLIQRLPDPRNAVILAGFQAQGTRGRALQEGAKTIRLFGQEIPVNAEIVELGQFSAHAGKSELLRWLTGLPAPPKQTYLVHGRTLRRTIFASLDPRELKVERLRGPLSGHNRSFQVTAGNTSRRETWTRTVLSAEPVGTGIHPEKIVEWH